MLESQHQRREGNVKAGVRSGDITPALGVELGGYPYFERANTGVNDPLVAVALYLDDQVGGTALILATDLFWITRSQADLIRNDIERATGVPAESIFVTCSHTHSAPWMSTVFEAGPGQPEFVTLIDDAYIAQASATLVKLATDAVTDTFDATLAYGEVSCGASEGIGGNRRDPANGTVDDSVPVLAVRDLGGDLRAVWTKYALHPTILHGENTLVSADFPGAMRSRVEAAHPEAAFMYSMGTAGDQSPRYFRTGQGLDEVGRFGHTLGDAVLAAVASAQPILDPRIRTAERAVDLPTKTYPNPDRVLERVEELRRKEAALIATGAPYTEVQTANLWLLGAECDYNNAIQALDGRLEARYRSGVPYTVSVLTVSDIAWVFTPGEVFCDFGAEIRDGSPFDRTNVVTLTNGHLPGYCVTQAALDEGGYEPGNSILAAASGHELSSAAVSLLTGLSQHESGS